MLGVLVQTVFVFLVLVALLAPFVLWLERRPAPLWQPAVNLVKLLSQSALPIARPGPGSLRLHGLAPALAVVTAASAFAVIPYGGRYRIGSHELSLVAADVEWGVPWVLALSSLGACVGMIAGWSGGSSWSRLGAVRVAAQLVSWQAALGLCLAPMLMIFGSFALSEIGLAQDTRFEVFALLRTVSGSELPAVLAAPTLPAWGILLNPPACVMFLVCAMAASEAPPFDAARAGSELVGGQGADYSGAALGLFTLAGAVRASLVAALVTTLFLGGWTLPWLPQARIEGAISPFLGEAVATILCLVLHVGAFLAKVSAVIWLQVRMRDFLPRVRQDQLMDLCWKVILPCSLANVFLTAIVLLALEVG